MKAEYDFSKAERGKFFRPNAVLEVPIYLDKTNQEFIAKLAKRKKKGMSEIVNQLLKSDAELAKAF